ncbi:solute carrier family 26 member 6, partial [Brachionichthys hirsutus]|uniref:solute carrier family 26 member 6 n=1 Tax=Brachionichthys hirsutus TaxID=412623 RepID=UPI0036043125
SSDIDITKILSEKKTLEEKRKRHEKRNAQKLERTSPVNGESENEEKKDMAFIEMEGEPDPSLPSAIELGLSPVNFLDVVGVKTLCRIRKDYGEIGVEVVLASCQTAVMDSLHAGGFFKEKVTKSCLFSTVHDAVVISPCVRTDTDCSRDESKKEDSEQLPVIIHSSVVYKFSGNEDFFFTCTMQTFHGYSWNLL